VFKIERSEHVRALTVCIYLGEKRAVYIIGKETGDTRKSPNTYRRRFRDYFANHPSNVTGIRSVGPSSINCNVKYGYRNSYVGRNYRFRLEFYPDGRCVNAVRFPVKKQNCSPCVGNVDNRLSPSGPFRTRKTRVSR